MHVLLRLQEQADITGGPLGRAPTLGVRDWDFDTWVGHTKVIKTYVVLFGIGKKWLGTVQYSQPDSYIYLPLVYVKLYS